MSEMGTEYQDKRITPAAVWRVSPVSTAPGICSWTRPESKPNTQCWTSPKTSMGFNLDSLQGYLPLITALVGKLQTAFPQEIIMITDSSTTTYIWCISAHTHTHTYRCINTSFYRMSAMHLPHSWSYLMLIKLIILIISSPSQAYWNYNLFLHTALARGAS